MSRKRFHGLKKVKIRATWNKFNLYNISRYKSSNYFLTFFQQKWKAKSATRAYHGEHVREKQWQRMFRRRMNAVVPMDHKYLAEFDGSECAAGTGSGLEPKPKEDKWGRVIPFGHEGNEVSSRPDKIPYTSMTYAPLERRLDMVIWRALFASSARQARQFVTRGRVKVNGQKIQFAGYLMNPGDMVQVEPEAVLYATGAPKPKELAKLGRKVQLRRRWLFRASDKRLRPLRVPALKKGPKEEAGSSSLNRTASTPLAIQEVLKARRDDFKALAQQLDDHCLKQIGVKSRKDAKDLIKKVKRAYYHYKDCTEEQLNDQLYYLLLSAKEITSRRPGYTESKAEKIAKEKLRQEAIESGETLEDDLSEVQKAKKLQSDLVRSREYSTDPTKPYATPWAPRPYMPAFAFIPRYLEVNQNICAAVYLRHPVARPGLAEVPSPFGPEEHQLAHNWYLRRR